MKKIIQHEVLAYLFFGILATLVYLISRFVLFQLTQAPVLSATIANLIAIFFAFWTNDCFVFRQATKGWPGRLIKFVTARLATLAIDLILAYLLVSQFPQLIGQFVNHNLTTVDAIASLFSQMLIILGNYFLSKYLIFTNKP